MKTGLEYAVLFLPSLLSFSFNKCHAHLGPSTHASDSTPLLSLASACCHLVRNVYQRRNMLSSAFPAKIRSHFLQYVPSDTWRHVSSPRTLLNTIFYLQVSAFDHLETSYGCSSYIQNLWRSSRGESA
jgi:hypothetical protein